MKLDKNTVQRRIDLMAEEGVTFACNTEVGSEAEISGMAAAGSTCGACHPKPKPVAERSGLFSDCSGVLAPGREASASGCGNARSGRGAWVLLNPAPGS